MKSIGELLAAKDRGPVITTPPDTTVFEAVTCMVKNNIGAILICDGEEIRGIMTERDYLRFVTDQGRTARNTPVSDLMTAKIVFVTPEAQLSDVGALMTECRIRHVPVMDQGKLVGIVSIGDVVKQISRDRKARIRHLEEYISDTYPR
ncbi:hypothetical protein COW53_07125 [bacterium CG17_big_fil_post_rev_8_21_14_2_50_64_8]|nr:MAG: hypothetical protein COW53_07125 [bacterium CG17_big_fil_post_rev_8_21_14_2_50_64_8]PJA73198.1 MAG: hypothetical protein CO151_14510 [bacterium CG_4_9_14_3_um_filter_65_15]